MRKYRRFLIFVICFIVTLISCKKVEEINQDPEIEPLKHGFKTSAAVGYCASLAYTFFKGEQLPDNVIIHSQTVNDETGSGILLATINDSYPLPFNSSVGQITIAGIWGNNGGVITVVFTDINIIENKYEFVGIKTIPIIELEDGKIMTLIAEQDIVIGNGSDTTLHLNMTNPLIFLELDRLEAEQPADPFIAAQQNVWFITIDQKNTPSVIHDDEYTINGGGQIVEVNSASGGMLYHAMIQAKFKHSTCEFNPLSGIGFIQNIKIGTQTDLGHIFLRFHETCDGKAYVGFASGKYLTSNLEQINLNFY